MSDSQPTAYLAGAAELGAGGPVDSLSAALARSPRLPPSGSSLSAHARMLYRAMSQQGAISVDHFQRLTGGAISATASLAELQALGLVRATEAGLVAIPRRQVIDELLAEQSHLLASALAHVKDRQRQINTLTAEAEALDVEFDDRIQTVAMNHANPASGLYDLTAQAKTSLMAIHPGGHFPPQVLEFSLERAQANLQAGVKLRVVHQVAALSHPTSVDYLTAIERLGGQVRLRDNLPFRMLLIDHNAAVCAAPVSEGGQETYLLRGRRVMALLDRMFETTWVDATPLTALLDPTRNAVEYTDIAVLSENVAELTTQQRVILRCLAEGETDQTIARRLGVTPRTVTRRIAEIYRELGVDSRFQAGAVAHRLGLV